ncbi:transmembrane protein 135 isoform X2 [Rhipicephalus sanguineus]|uniref:transmembrane protein 135 isoform X1 n=1 Tax=Rhipicephalus sanguineus TaxID=34632 RepID=UPI001895A344|nr:transmembrane protein 135 isoform X1 [Rhipicephalus sanguineus]XP_049266874.1 transmembrane protein 135 isoform X2 [Rhipicephalus sanguineus]
MGQVWSNLWDVQLPFNCYETAHTWTPMCHRAWIDLFKDVMASTFPLHLIFYSTSALTRAKGEPLEQLILSYVIGNSLRSSLSIAYCFFFLCAFACISSAYLGHFSPGQVLFSCLAAVYLGIKLEEPRRVQALLVSMLRLAAEVAFATLQHSGVLPEGLDRFQVPLFAASLAGIVWLARATKSKDLSVKALRMFLGFQLIPCKHGDSAHGTNDDRKFRTALSCFASSLTRFVVFTSVGTAASFVLTWGRRVDPRPGLFLGSFGAVYSLTRCLLRLRGSSRSWHDPTAALLAGLCLALWPSPRITLFFVFKFLELCYSRGEEAGVLPSGSEGTHSALFAICCGVLLTVGVLQPHLVRPSYRAFIDRVIGKRMRYINVPAIATLGYGTTNIVPDVPVTMPELDPRFVSRRYKETLWVWAQ